MLGVYVVTDKMVTLGYKQSDIVRAVEENQCNETMATYLLLQQHYSLVCTTHVLATSISCHL